MHTFALHHCPSLQSNSISSNLLTTILEIKQNTIQLKNLQIHTNEIRWMFKIQKKNIIMYTL